MGIPVFHLDTVRPGTGGNNEIGGRDGQPFGPAASGQLTRLGPDHIRGGQEEHIGLQLFHHLAFRGTSHPVPQFHPHMSHQAASPDWSKASTRLRIPASPSRLNASIRLDVSMSCTGRRVSGKPGWLEALQV